MLQTLGRLHPFLVHFPIALLCAALVAELRQPRAQGPSGAGTFCLTLGTLGAVAAALSGWLFAQHDPPGHSLLLARHRWSGVGTAALAVLTLASAWRWRRGADARCARATRIGLGLSALMVLVTGALGGEMVYGEGFVLEPLSPEHAPAPPPAAPLALPVAVPVGRSPPVDYLAQIRPLLEHRCFECHGERKRPKGNLALSDLVSVLARPAEEAVIVPGAPEASALYQRLVLPADHEDRMPPEEGPLPPEEIELVRRWIAEGASWVPLEAPPASPSGPARPAAPALVLSEAQRAARDEAFARLRARGVRAQPLASTSDEVEADFGVAADPCGDAELELLAGLEPCLVELSLARSGVSDAGLARLSGFHGLRRLRLGHTRVGDAGLAHLARLAALESLDLFGTRVGDASLAVLRSLPRLARLYTGQSALGDAALDELARARPELVIERGRLPRQAGPR